MAFIPPLLSGSAQLTLTSTATSTMTTLMAGTVKDFFLNLFMHPGENSTAVMIMGGLTVAACVGLAFLIMKLYERCCPERNT
jgi:hypothetical protein